VKRLALGLTPLILIVAACAHGQVAGGVVGGAAHPKPLAHVRRDGIAFSYPAAWIERRAPLITPMSESLVDLSTQRMVNPCRPWRGATMCGWPIRRLRPGGIVVAWSLLGAPALPGHTFRPGVTVARIRDSLCGRIGGDEALHGRLVTRRHRVYDALACLAGPRRDANVRAFRAIMASARPA
jgi:hypothetical protein